MAECYMCDKPGITREHVPPRSFHPKGYRKGLITVPSCEQHNLGNSLDVEAVRNMVPLSHATNEVGLSLAEGEVIRSFQRSQGLAVQTLVDMKPIVLNGEEMGSFKCDVPRIKNIMRSIAHGMHYHIFGERFPHEWEVFISWLKSRESLVDGTPDGWEKFRQMCSECPYGNVDTPQPLVFQCGLYLAPDGILKVFRFTFYGGNVVYAFTKRP